MWPMGRFLEFVFPCGSANDMLIHCTKIACERLKIMPPDAKGEYDPLYSWRMHVLQSGRERIAVFMNDASRYCVVIAGIRARHWQCIPELFIEHLRQVMLADGIDHGAISAYFAAAGEMAYFLNHDRQMTSWLNKTCEAVWWGFERFSSALDVSLFVCHFLAGSNSEKTYWVPSDRFKELILPKDNERKKVQIFGVIWDGHTIPRTN